MALIHVMLGTARVYLEAREAGLAIAELGRALEKAKSMRPTRRVRIVRAHIAQCIVRATDVYAASRLERARGFNV